MHVSVCCLLPQDKLAYERFGIWTAVITGMSVVLQLPNPEAVGVPFHTNAIIVSKSVARTTVVCHTTPLKWQQIELRDHFVLETINTWHHAVQHQQQSPSHCPSLLTAATAPCISNPPPPPTHTQASMCCTVPWQQMSGQRTCCCCQRAN